MLFPDFTGDLSSNIDNQLMTIVCLAYIVAASNFKYNFKERMCDGIDLDLILQLTGW